MPTMSTPSFPRHGWDRRVEIGGLGGSGKTLRRAGRAGPTLLARAFHAGSTSARAAAADSN